ncbi:MAG: 16S rRNA (guanine(527)-N(7))-methyltransferase RsmG [Treponema sp.]|nr:16S rRNA (guanine(527)-N(7))-methyltransferase RsmG [Treponema sp.]
MNDNLLEEGLKMIAPGEADLKRIGKLLTAYVNEIELFNKAYGLVKVQDRRELIVKHIFDSLAPLHIIRRLLDEMITSGGKAGTLSNTLHVADVGSGAGLPGIPLAANMEDVRFTLIERMGRRAGFLRNTLAVMGLTNADIEEADMEETKLRGCFDLIVFRAFRPLEPDIFKGLLRLLASGGILAAYKGRRETVEEEMRLLLDSLRKDKTASIAGWEILPVKVPFLEEKRHLLVIRPAN